MNAKRNFQASGPCNYLRSCHIWRVPSKNERVEGQKVLSHKLWINGPC
jgi:hypothetical protein